MNRRAFLGAAATMAVGGGALAAEAKPLEITDSHVHIWDLKKLKLPWVKKGDEVLDRDYGVEDYLAATKGLNVTKAVYVEVAVDAKQHVEEGEGIATLCESGKTPFVAAVIGGDPAGERFAAYLDRFKRSKVIKGVRRGWRKGMGEDDRFLAGLRLLGERGLTFDLQLSRGQWQEAADVARRCGETRFVVDHGGALDPGWFGVDGAGPDDRGVAREAWRRGMSALAERPNVWCKVSGVAESGARGATTERVVSAIVDRCVGLFGEDRVMFGGNWPVCRRAIELADWVGMLLRVTGPRGEPFRRKLFAVNAARFYDFA
jgi:L-fuconolactonase